ncbi:MAG: cupredoxin family protein [Rhizobiales bacterium]|nr:cupredoxin family protein [Hyphomicrobiales bacterium]
MSKKLALLAFAATVALTGVSMAHGPSSPAGEAGHRANVTRTVELTMVEGEGRMLFEPAEITINRGDTVRFVVKNGGALEHEMVIDTLEGNQRHKAAMERNPDMEHADPNSVKVEPTKTGEIVWRFTNSGTFEFACLIPGHYQAGMHGRIVVR